MKTPRTWQPQATHARSPRRAQAIQYTGDNAEQVIAWAAARGLAARVTSWNLSPAFPHQEVRCAVHWVASQVHADGGLHPGDWLVMTLPDGEMQGWSAIHFAQEYRPLKPA